jgi:hypothetical protein
MIRVLIFILAFFPAHLCAETVPFSAPLSSGPGLKLNVVTDQDPVYSGGRFTLYISVQIEEGWHIYSLRPLDGNGLLATRITLQEGTFETTGEWKESSTHLIQDDAQEKMVKGHSVTAEFQKNFQVPQDSDSGIHSIEGKLIYRACDNKLCTLPQSLPFITWLQVEVGN